MEPEKMEMSKELPIRLVIKRKGFEISAEGTISSITPAIEEIADFVNKLEAEFETESSEEETNALPTVEEVAITPSADAPVIKVTKSVVENVTSLFNTPWGRTPHFLAEVIKALEVNADYQSPQAVNTTLVRLVRRGILRRIQRDGKFAYVKAAGE